jgi:hypothetical protein
MRSKRMQKIILMSLCAILSPSIVAAQTPAPPPPLDGPNAIFHDSLLDNFAGNWTAVRARTRQTTTSAVHVEWLLNHQFIEIHYRDTVSASGYDAMVFIGHDNVSDRYVAHWIDIYGGRFSETLGYGTRDGNAIRFVFEYPDGPFVNTYTWNPADRSWTSLMRQKNAAGAWTTFATERFTRQR